MTIEIDGVQALALLEQAVAERGAGYTYQSEFGESTCQYAVGGKPACLVGVALHNAGVEVAALRRLDLNEFTTEDGVEFDTGDTSITDLAFATTSWDDGEEYPSPLSLFGIVLTKEALKAFQVAQKAQDDGETWGEAFAKAKAQEEVA